MITLKSIEIMKRGHLLDPESEKDAALYTVARMEELYEFMDPEKHTGQKLRRLPDIRETFPTHFYKPSRFCFGLVETGADHIVLKAHKTGNTYLFEALQSGDYDYPHWKLDHVTIKKKLTKQQNGGN